MKKKVIYGIIGMLLSIAMLSGCNPFSVVNQIIYNANHNNNQPVPVQISEVSSDDATEIDTMPYETAEDEGRVLNIWCPSEGLCKTFEEVYPGYERIDYETGMIGDVKICWTYGFDDYYWEDLDQNLYDNNGKEDDERIDLYIVDSFHLQQFIAAGYAMPLANVGVTKEDLSMQYQYTRDMAEDAKGWVCGFAYNATPGAFWYRRDIAMEVLGTDEPQAVQQYVSDWGNFYDTAGVMKDAGYYITQDTDLLFRVFMSDKELPWISHNEFKYDENVVAWAMLAKELCGKEYIKDVYFLDDSDCSDVFGYFAPIWMEEIFYDLKFEDGWGICAAPENFYYAGDFICVPPNTNNPTLIHEILVTLATNEEVLRDIAEKSYFVNNTNIMEEIANDEAYCNDMLGGQNPYNIYCNVADKIYSDAVCEYELACENEFRNAMLLYIHGEHTYAEALRNYELAIKEEFPELCQ